METEGLMDIHEVAAFLNVSPGTLYHWNSERRGPPSIHLSSRCLRWRRSDVNAWVSERVDKGGQEHCGQRNKRAVVSKGSDGEQGAVQETEKDMVEK